MAGKPRFGVALMTVVVASAFAVAARTEPRTKVAEAGAASAVITNCETFLPYSNDPNHIWNRVHRLLLVRTAPDGSLWGCDEVDPLLWLHSEHVLVGNKYEEALRLLDEFLAAHAERQVRDPMKRALFQRNLWGFFNWVLGPEWPGMTAGDRERIHFAERRQLATRVARMIRAVALTPEQIRRLPDNFSALRGAATADGFELPDGEGWVLISRDDGIPAAVAHTDAFPRSVFLAYLKLGSGSPKPGPYLEALRQYSRTRDPSVECRFMFRCNPPQFEVGTEVALARRALLIDSNGRPVVSPLVESIQLRRYIRIPHDSRDAPLFQGTQRAAEFRLSERELLEGGPGLRRVGEEEKGFVVFASHGQDAFEPSSPEAQMFAQAALRNGRFEPRFRALSCESCHQTPGVNSFTSYSRMQFSDSQGAFVMVHASSEEEEASAALRDIESQPRWKALAQMMAAPAGR